MVGTLFLMTSLFFSGGDQGSSEEPDPAPDAALQALRDRVSRLEAHVAALEERVDEVDSVPSAATAQAETTREADRRPAVIEATRRYEIRKRAIDLEIERHLVELRSLYQRRSALEQEHGSELAALGERPAGEWFVQVQAYLDPGDPTTHDLVEDLEQAGYADLWLFPSSRRSPRRDYYYYYYLRIGPYTTKADADRETRRLRARERGFARDVSDSYSLRVPGESPRIAASDWTGDGAR